jgi:hypothetical protein
MRSDVVRERRRRRRARERAPVECGGRAERMRNDVVEESIVRERKRPSGAEEEPSACGVMLERGE